MTEQERINSEVQMKLALQDAKFNAFVQEMRDFKTEMRDRDNQRAEDMREIRSSISNMQNRIDDMGKHVRNLSITSMAAIGAMVVTVIISLLKG
ncbi:MAG: hypothetical protein IJQ01_03005 [Selenomonadaceae bacterium]|nr:hypothetical protein [Selenomonadaceae bacterium]MBR0102450.1 hypothetical protein [Selenomonadaceae bacterium]